MYTFKCQGNFYVMNILSILEGRLSKAGESLLSRVLHDLTFLDDSYSPIVPICHSFVL